MRNRIFMLILAVTALTPLTSNAGCQRAADVNYDLRHLPDYVDYGEDLVAALNHSTFARFALQRQIGVSNDEALGTVGTCMSVPERLELIRAAASQGDPWSLFFLADYYERGLYGLAVNRWFSRQLFNRAAESGVEAAMERASESR